MGAAFTILMRFSKPTDTRRTCHACLRASTARDASIRLGNRRASRTENDVRRAGAGPIRGQRRPRVACEMVEDHGPHNRRRWDDGATFRRDGAAGTGGLWWCGLIAPGTRGAPVARESTCTRACAEEPQRRVRDQGAHEEGCGPRARGWGPRSSSRRSASSASGRPTRSDERSAVAGQHRSSPLQLFSRQDNAGARVLQQVIHPVVVAEREAADRLFCW